MKKCAVIALMCAAAALSGCSVEFSSSAKPSVSKEDLQKDISDRLAKAGEAPESVTCKADLVGEVGRTTECDVVLSPTNSFEPIVEVTGVDGSTVSYKMTPAASKAQLDEQVSILVERNEGSQVTAVSCESGLVGVAGQKAYCDVDTRGSVLRRTVEVTTVDGLLMSFVVYPKLSKAEIESSLLDQLAPRLGNRPDSADCTDDLDGIKGTTIECAVGTGADRETYVVSVLETDGGAIRYNFEPKR